MGCVRLWETHVFCLQLRQIYHSIIFNTDICFLLHLREFPSRQYYARWKSMHLSGFSPVVAKQLLRIPVTFSSAKEEHSTSKGVGSRAEPPKKEHIAKGR